MLNHLSICGFWFQNVFNAWTVKWHEQIEGKTTESLIELRLMKIYILFTPSVVIRIKYFHPLFTSCADSSFKYGREEKKTEFRWWNPPTLLDMNTKKLRVAAVDVHTHTARAQRERKNWCLSLLKTNKFNHPYANCIISGYIARICSCAGCCTVYMYCLSYVVVNAIFVWIYAESIYFCPPPRRIRCHKSIKLMLGPIYSLWTALKWSRWLMSVHHHWMLAMCIRAHSHINVSMWNKFVDNLFILNLLVVLMYQMAAAIHFHFVNAINVAVLLLRLSQFVFLLLHQFGVWISIFFSLFCLAGECFSCLAWMLQNIASNCFDEYKFSVRWHWVTLRRSCVCWFFNILNRIGHFQNETRMEIRQQNKITRKKRIRLQSHIKMR